MDARAACREHSNKKTLVNGDLQGDRGDNAEEDSDTHVRCCTKAPLAALAVLKHVPSLQRYAAIGRRQMQGRKLTGQREYGIDISIASTSMSSIVISSVLL